MGDAGAGIRWFRRKVLSNRNILVKLHRIGKPWGVIFRGSPSCRPCCCAVFLAVGHLRNLCSSPRKSTVAIISSNTTRVYLYLLDTRQGCFMLPKFNSAAGLNAAAVHAVVTNTEYVRSPHIDRKGVGVNIPLPAHTTKMQLSKSAGPTIPFRRLPI